MGDRTLFFYGTLMAPPVLHRVIYGSSHPDPQLFPAMKHLVVKPALLHGHRRHRVADADYPAIIPEEGGLVRGSIVTGLTEGDVWRLDIFEGSQYRRNKVPVKVLQGVALNEAAEVQAKLESEEAEEVVAETYIWKDPIDELDPHEWDFEVFKRDKMRAWMGQASWGDEDASAANQNGDVVVDEGFADVDKAVAQQHQETGSNRTLNGKVKDPTGGRGLNGDITKQLQEAHQASV